MGETIGGNASFKTRIARGEDDKYCVCVHVYNEWILGLLVDYVFLIPRQERKGKEPRSILVGFVKFILLKAVILHF